MNAAEFRELVLSEFPQLREDFEEWHDLVHLQVMEFLIFTQNAIEARSFETVSKCFDIANSALTKGDSVIRNAIYVSYLEGLELRSEAGKQAAQLLPAALLRGRNDILDYDKHLLGRKWRTNER